MNQETLKPGLVSITFRKLSAEEIVRLVAKAKLIGIEWGGDVHVPHGEIDRAREVRKISVDAGLTIPAYGSYYRAAHSETEGLSFDRVLATALGLGAPTIRVWAGRKASDKATADDRRAVADDLARIADLAAQEKVTISLEYHGGTLTDTIESTRSLLEAVPQVYTLWQPPVDESVEHNLASLQAVLPRLTNVHVFHWAPRTRNKLPLSDGEAAWRQYLALLRQHGGERYLILEFVRNDSSDQFLQDAATLRGWLEQS